MPEEPWKFSANCWLPKGGRHSNAEGAGRNETFHMESQPPEKKSTVDFTEGIAT